MMCVFYALLLLLILAYNFNYKVVDMNYGYLPSYPKIIKVNLMINNNIFDFDVKRNWRIYK